MNKIYKLVWSKVRNAWVVTSEIAKGHGKDSSSERNGKRLKLAVMTAILGGCFMTAGMSPVAALTPDQQAVYDAVMAKLTNGGKIELGGTSGSNSGVAIGGLSEAAAQGTVAIGESAKGYFQSVAIGQDAQARWIDDTPNMSGNNIAIGASTRAYAANGIAQGNYASVYGTQGIAIGLQATVGEKPLTEQEYNDKVASGEISAADKKLYVRSEESNGNFVYRKLDTTGTDRTKDHFRGIAIGSLAQSNAVDSIALGSGAETYGDSSMATGYNAKAEGDYSMALGVQSNSTKRFSIAIGPLANASEANAVAIGYGTKAKTSGGVAIGAGSVATAAGGEVGYTTDAEQAKKLKEQAALAVEFNTLFKAYQNASSGSTEEAEARTKLQDFAKQHAEFMSAKDGLATWRATDGAVSVGDSAKHKTRQITNLAAGTKDTDAVNVAQLKALNTKVEGNKIHYLSIGPANSNLAPGGNYDNDAVEQDWGIAIGVDASSKDGDGIAMGKDSRSRGYSSIGLGSLSSAVGDYSTATGHESQAFGDSASAFGALARAYGANGVAIGGGALVSNSKSLTKAEYDALPEEEKALYHTEKTRQDEFYQYKQKNASGEIKDIEVNGVAVGNYASSIGYGGVSVGNFAKSMGKGGVAIGDHAKASDKDNIQNSAWGVALGAYSQNKVEQGVAIGTLSVADRAKDVKGYLPTTGKSIENIEEVMEATGKAEAFNQFKKDYAAATAKLNEAKTAYEANTADNTLKTTFEQAQKKVDDLTNQYSVMTAPWISKKGAVSIGNDKTGFTRQLTGLAAGSEDTDAVNVAQLKVVNAKVDKAAADITTINDKITNLTTNTGSGVHYFSVVSDPADETTSAGTNWKNDGAKGNGSIAIGRNASAQSDWSTAIGYKSNTQGEKSTAIGTQSSANGDEALAMGFLAKAEGPHAHAIGAQSKANGKATNAFGQYAKAEGLGATAFGFRAAATSEGSLALGPNTQVTAKFGTAIGLGAIAMQEEGVALGTQSLANRAPMTPGYNPTGEQWSDFQDYLTKTGQKDVYDRANEKLQVAKQALAPFDENHRNTPEAREAFAKYMQAGKELNDIFSTWAGAKGAISIGNESVGMTRQLTGLAAGTKDTDAVNVAQLKALNTKVDKGAIHYYSVTSDKKAAGSNFDNDGAKAADSMVIGIGSSSEAPNSTVLGNNNTLKRYNADRNGSSSRNNIVVGQNMEVEGAHNAVFGTDYQNNRENRKTMVAGKYNTVIGVGNLAGYTAEKDPQDRFKWIYKKVQGGSDSGNVVVGMNNTATRGSIVIGAGSEASSLGTSVGSNNKVIGNGNGGLALGNSLTVDGEQAVAIGSESQAKADYAVAIGQEALAEKESTIAFGNSAKAQNEYSVAFGSFATATARSGVALGSSSLANREKGAIGYLADANTTSEAWKATRGAISIGNSDKKYTRQLTGLAAGTEGTDAVNVAQLKVVNAKVDKNTTDITELTTKIKNAGGVHYFSVKSDDKNASGGTNWDNDGATGKDAIAIGRKARAYGMDSQSMGENAWSIGNYSQAWGYYALAGAEEGIDKAAYDALSDAEKENYTLRELSIGGVDKSLYYRTTFKEYTNDEFNALPEQERKNLTSNKGYGYDSNKEVWTSTPRAIAIGHLSKALGAATVAVGNLTEATGIQSTAIGTQANASGGFSFAAGDRAKAQNTGTIAIGMNANTSGEWSTAIGSFVEASGKWGTALGLSAKAQSEKGVALGASSLADREKGTVGYLAENKETEEWKATLGAVSVGNTTKKQTRQITNVAAGAADTDAVNVAQLKVVNDKADKNAKNITSLTTKVDGNTTDIMNLKKVSGKVIDGTNTTVEVGDENGTKTYKVNVAANGQIADGNTGIVTGDTVYKFVNPIKNQVTNIESTVNNLKGGFTIKDAAGTTTEVTLGETTKPAITFNAATEDTDGAASALTAKVDADKNVTYTLNTKKLKEEMGLTQGVGSMSSWNLKATGDTKSEAIADGNTVEFAVAAADKGLTVAREGKTIKYGIDSDKLIDNINSNTTKKITNVDGSKIDISNNTSIKTINENITNLTGKATKVTVDGEENKADGNLKIKKTEKDGQLTYDLSLNDNITIGKDGKDGKIGINGKDGKSADITVGKGEAGVDGKDGITRIIYKDQGNKTHEVATLDDGLKFKGDNDDVVIRKLNTQLNITGGAKADELSDNNIGVVGKTGDQGGMTVKLSKKLKGLTSAEFVDGDNITNITGGNVTITRKEGNTTNKVDLWELNKIVNNITAGTTDVSSWKLQANGANDRTIKKDSIVNFTNGTATKVTVKDNDVTVDLNDATKKQINDNTTNINNMKNDITNIQNTVNNIDTKIEQKIEGSKIKVEGDDKTGIKVKEDKVNGKVKGYKVSLDEKVKVGNVAIDGKDGKGEITGLTNTTVDAADFATKGRAATEEQLKAAMGKVQAQSRTTVKGSNNITVTPKTPNAAEYTVGLAKDISVDSVTAKKYKVGDKTYISDKGINANKNKITNVADGVVSKDSKDAVNGSQLFTTNQMVVNNMNQINNLREESREGDALGAAMAALKPLDFDPYQRSQVMAGVGYYRGKEAVALGLAHYKNEDLMFHGGIAYAGNSELMANVGVSYRFGSKDDRDIKHDRNLRMPQYAEGPISSVYILQDEVDRLTKENKEANDRIAALEAKLEKVLEKVK